MAALDASLRAWDKAVYLDKVDTRSPAFVFKHSLHREKGKKKDYGLTLKQRKEQFKEKRNAKNSYYARKVECDLQKPWEHCSVLSVTGCKCSLCRAGL